MEVAGAAVLGLLHQVRTVEMEVAGAAVPGLLHQVRTVEAGEVNPPQARRMVMATAIMVGMAKVSRRHHPMVEINSTVPMEIRDMVVTAAMAVAVVTVGMVTRVPRADTAAAMEEAMVAATETVTTVSAIIWIKTLIGKQIVYQRFKRIFMWNTQM